MKLGENKKVLMVDLDENDNKIKGTERIAWDSRSVAVVVVVYCKDLDKYILEKRGEGCPDEVGKLVFPCGYLGWGETPAEAGAREVYEEIGLSIDPKSLELVSVSGSPYNNRQNVSLAFLATIEGTNIDELICSKDSSERGGEACEVEEVLFTDLQWIRDNRNLIAFNHDVLLDTIIDNPGKVTLR